MWVGGFGGVKGQRKKGGTFSEEGSLEKRGNNYSHVKKAPTTPLTNDSLEAAQTSANLTGFS